MICLFCKRECNEYNSVPAPHTEPWMICASCIRILNTRVALAVRAAGGVQLKLKKETA